MKLLLTISCILLLSLSSGGIIKEFLRVYLLWNTNTIFLVKENRRNSCDIKLTKSNSRSLKFHNFYYKILQQRHVRYHIPLSFSNILFENPILRFTLIIYQRCFSFHINGIFLDRFISLWFMISCQIRYVWTPIEKIALLKIIFFYCLTIINFVSGPLFFIVASLNAHICLFYFFGWDENVW